MFAQTNGDPANPMGSFHRDRYAIRFKAISNPNFVSNSKFIGTFNPAYRQMLGIEESKDSKVLSRITMPRLCSKCNSSMTLHVVSKGNVNKGIEPKITYKCFSEQCQFNRAKKQSDRIKEKHKMLDRKQQVKRDLSKKQKAIQLTTVL